MRSFYEQLIERGYVPKREEIEDLADITFEYLLEKCMIDEVLMKRMSESNDGLNSSFLLFTNLSQIKSEIIGIIKRNFTQEVKGCSKIIDSLLGKKNIVRILVVIIAIEVALIQVAIINDVHLVMGIIIIKESVKAVASFQVADEMASYTSFI